MVSGSNSSADRSAGSTPASPPGGRPPAIRTRPSCRSAAVAPDRGVTAGPTAVNCIVVGSKTWSTAIAEDQDPSVLERNGVR